MEKNILVLTGSSRIKGNSDLLAEEFSRGARESGAKVERFDTGRKTIQPCQACDRCFSNGTACVMDEEFNKLAPLLANADALALVTPLYWYSFPSSIKAAIDKLYAFIVGERPLSVRESMLVVCGDMSEERVFEGIRTSYRLILEDRKWIDRGQLIVTGVNGKGEVQSTDALQRARQLGRTMAGTSRGQ